MNTWIDKKIIIITYIHLFFFMREKLIKVDKEWKNLSIRSVIFTLSKEKWENTVVAWFRVEKRLFPMHEREVSWRQSTKKERKNITEKRKKNHKSQWNWKLGNGIAGKEAKMRRAKMERNRNYVNRKNEKEVKVRKKMLMFLRNEYVWKSYVQLMRGKVVLCIENKVWG